MLVNASMHYISSLMFLNFTNPIQTGHRNIFSRKSYNVRSDYSYDTYNIVATRYNYKDGSFHNRGIAKTNFIVHA